jgi:hypothetical protein
LSSVRYSECCGRGNLASSCTRSPRGCSGLGRPTCSHHRSPGGSDGNSYDRPWGYSINSLPTCYPMTHDRRLAQPPTRARGQRRLMMSLPPSVSVRHFALVAVTYGVKVYNLLSTAAIDNGSGGSKIDLRSGRASGETLARAARGIAIWDPRLKRMLYRLATCARGAQIGDGCDQFHAPRLGG